MKFNSLIRIFLLVNIAFSLVSVNSNYTKKRAKISTNRRVHSKTKTKGIATILTNLQNAFSQPGNILNFVLGVLGEFIPAIDSIKGAISPAVLQATGECNSLFQIGTDQKTINGFAEMENKLANVQDKQKFCQDTKKNIEMAYLYSQAGEEPSLVGFLKLPGAIFSSAFSSAEDICNSIYTNTNKRNKANEILQFLNISFFLVFYFLLFSFYLFIFLLLFLALWLFDFVDLLIRVYYLSTCPSIIIIFI